LTTFLPEELVTRARQAGFAEASTVSADALGQRYFAGRSDGLWPSPYQDLLVATTA